MSRGRGAPGVRCLRRARGACPPRAPTRSPDSLKAHSLVRRHHDHLRAQPRSHRRPRVPASGTFDEDGTYTPRQIVDDDLGGVASTTPIDGTMVDVEDGQLVEGTVVKVDRDEVLLDIGYKSEGVIPARELSIRNDVDPNEIVSLGDEVEALVLTEGGQGRPPRPVQEAGPVRAGLGHDREDQGRGRRRHRPGHRGRQGRPHPRHRPARLPARLARRAAPGPRPAALRRPQSLEAKIIELDKNRNNVVLSRRAWLEETQKEQREDFLANLKPGEVRKGVVSRSSTSAPSSTSAAWTASSTCPSCRGSTSTTPARSCRWATRSTVQVLDVDLDRERISLSLKATQQDPWQEFATSHRVGELVYGRVTKLVPFGAFVQVGDGIEGLVHISEMSAHHVDLPEQVVTPGEELWVKIIDLDLQRRRISLSIKQAAEGGVVAAEYQEHFGEHAYDDEGNYIGARVHRGRGGLGRVLRRAPRGGRRGRRGRVEGAEAAEAEAVEAEVAEAAAEDASE